MKGSSDYFLQRAASVTLPVSATTEKPDILLLLQESTVNPNIYRLPDGTQLPNLFMFQQDNELIAHSHMRVQTFGGGLGYLSLRH